MNSCMIDIESFGIGPNAALIAIGAVRFDTRSLLIGSQTKNVFSYGVNLQSCLDAGLRVDGSTVEWWLSRPKEQQVDILRSRPGVPLAKAMNALSLWWSQDAETKYPWSHGSMFDIVILESAFKAVGLAPPWFYYNVRDTRTLFDVAGFDFNTFKTKNKKPHDAYNDAVVQAEGVITCLKKLGYTEKGAPEEAKKIMIPDFD